MGLRRVDPRAFLDERARDAVRISLRRSTLAAHPERVAVWQPDEHIATALRWLDPDVDTGDIARAWNSVTSDGATDFVLVDSRELRVRAISVAFPSGWAPESKLGLSTSEIHGAVPALERALGTRIARFLSGLERGAAYQRDNWGLALGLELDRHPGWDRQPLSGYEPLTSIVLRVEEQIFVGIEGGVLFGIHIAPICLDRVAIDSAQAEALAHQLETMPTSVATYKGLDSARGELVRRLRAPQRV